MSIRLHAIAPSAVLVLALAGSALAQPGGTVTGAVQDWQDGEAVIVLLAPRHLPPPFERPADSPEIGTVDADGSFTLTLPESFPGDAFVPVDEFLDPGCEEGELVPEDATYFPVAYGVYDADGGLVGEIFQATGGPAAARGPVLGGYSVLRGFAEEGFTFRGSCPDPNRRVVEAYDIGVEAGWHTVVQRFEEDPERSGWRIDRWRQEPVPEDAAWVLIRPPG